MGRRMKYIVFVFLMLHQVTDAATPATPNNIAIGSYLFEQVLIEGSTNLTQFQLSYSEDTFSLLPACNLGSSEFLMMAIPAQKINAESLSMQNDFMELINANIHPTIIISLNEKITSDKLNLAVLRHQISLTMNGVTKTYACFSEIKKKEYDNWHLTGRLGVRLTDFGIEPPRKFFGLVKVDDEVFISFKILFSTEIKEARN